MTLGTPIDVYDAEHASSLLKSVGDDAVKMAIRDLQEQNVVSMLVRDPTKQKPGRTFKISDQSVSVLIPCDGNS